MKDSTSDLAIEWSLEGAYLSAQLVQKPNQFAIEVAETKLRVLDQYERPVRVKELRSDLEKARSDELAKQASLSLSQAILTKMQRDGTAHPALTKRQEQMLSLLKIAIPIEEKWRNQLEQAEKGGGVGEAQRNEIVNVARHLREIVDLAAAGEEAAAWNEFRAKIKRTAPRDAGNASSMPPRTGESAPFVSKQDSAAIARPGGFVADSRNSLRNLRSEIMRLGKQIPDGAGARPGLRDQLTNQTIAERSTAANYENAKLSREVAEIALEEYKLGVYVQDEQTARDEVALAKRNIQRATDMVAETKERLAAIRKTSRGSAQDLYYEYVFEDKVVDAQEREPKARLALEAAQAKLETLLDHTGPKTLRNLQYEVETARLDELAKQTAWEAEKLRTKSLREAVDKPEQPIPEERSLAALDRAVQIAEQAREQAESDQERRGGR